MVTVWPKSLFYYPTVIEKLDFSHPMHPTCTDLLGIVDQNLIGCPQFCAHW